MTAPFSAQPPDDVAPPMRRRSYAIVRTVLTITLIGAIELWAKSYLDWPSWVRYTLYFLGVALVRRFIPAPDWPDAEAHVPEDAPGDDPPRDSRASIAEAG